MKGEGDCTLKRKIIVLSIAVMILASCTQNTDEIENETVEEQVTNVDENKIEEEIKTYTSDPAKLHFVVDWLSDEKVVFVEKDAGIYYVKTFDINTGEVNILYEESMIIVDVLIHPSKKSFLLHMTDDSSSATIKVLSFEGMVLDEITIASSELSIEWNDVDPSLILLTAFYKDWTYDVFLYNGQEDEIGLISLQDPFPKWLGTEKIVTIDVAEHPLDGGELILTDRVSESIEPLNLKDIVYFETNMDSLLIVQVVGEDANYKIINQKGEILSQWTLPAVSNYSEWVIPEFSWMDDNTVIMASASEAGQLDSLGDSFELVRIEEGNLEVLTGYLPTGAIHCSANGKKCLTGYAAETIIDTVSKEEVDWLLLNE